MSTAATHTAKCLACGRTRYFRTAAAAAKAAPNGRICRVKIVMAAMAEAAKGFAAKAVAKAMELITDGGLIATSRPDVFRAVSSDGSQAYLTHPQTCSCAAARRGRAVPCYHSLAARIAVAARKAA